MKMHELFDKYAAECVPKLQQRTQIDYGRHLKKLRAAFGERDVTDIKPRDIGLYLDTPTGRITRNREVAVLSAVFRKAVSRWWLIEHNPCREVERNESSPRDRYVTDEEYSAFYATCNTRIQIAMDLALLTGQRQGDLLKLRWSQVTPDGVVFRQSKTGKRLMVSLSADLLAVLERAKALKPDLPREYVLRKENGLPYSEHGFRAMWQYAMRRAHKGRKRRNGSWKREPVLAERFTFHDLRGKSASDACTIQDAYERLGHTSMSMTRRVYDRAIRKVHPLR